MILHQGCFCWRRVCVSSGSSERRLRAYSLPTPPKMMPSGKAGLPRAWIMLLLGRG
ncbi:hypothetical protein NEIMUCOT_05409 [Neisseria mucosa ATCC 25996]|uniref:Uncharacterized protein n=1 Tax=Neisseria mucosa (strain ATCC 25996 / DSM 4631 / NCTC 10774 / M26) TaxID=546266 RepID=D2ZXQ5_NEIM2|nr:hypothetical protein NEIMUCOT_05409 [Neisseria mucosa ATCC 25996]